MTLLTSKTARATVFAPTNAAFAAFKAAYGIDISSPGVIAALLQSSPALLGSILM